MNLILAVDKSADVYAHQLAEWAKLAIGIQRADTMHEAIKVLSQGDNFIFIAINENRIYTRGRNKMS